MDGDSGRRKKCGCRFGEGEGHASTRELHGTIVIGVQYEYVANKGDEKGLFLQL